MLYHNNHNTGMVQSLQQSVWPSINMAADCSAAVSSLNGRVKKSDDRRQECEGELEEGKSKHSFVSSVMQIFMDN